MGEARWGVGEAMHADRIHFPPSAGLGVPRASGPMRGAHVDAADPLAFSARSRAMAMSRAWVAQEPTRDAVDAMRGPVLLEFGTGWCPHCLAAEPLLDHALQQRDDTAHLRIEDGRGRRLGRSFGVKLWPTFVLMRDGVEHARSVRPRSLREIEALFDDAEPAR